MQRLPRSGPTVLTQRLFLLKLNRYYHENLNLNQTSFACFYKFQVTTMGGGTFCKVGGHKCTSKKL